ncbi:aldehyde dehydrogenase (NADP(+)) [Alpinimonas psychrophila]|uniref:NADP-dependent aldehyde dehydrogenase n=1 Tax=Alpinimonas psychrophila TaxID=748908 RepID=A0A7W3JUV0_9MICO|nr:aldehyde dehydrogenase (NADP(+)) [Alpinimonas psychrophila]MBA8829628.1 NADP-dependent aldehyde dehydrogenase [Alpinimonas psychrophila]
MSAPEAHVSTTTDVVALEVDVIARIAAGAASAWAGLEPARRAGALVAAADALQLSRDELVAIAMTETGLSEARLNGELTRTAVQLKLFAETIVDGTYLDVRLDAADPEFVLGPRPDVRRYLLALGPVVNFAASNFPFAFSVAGGDTAAALAAGCPVIVKAHSGHPKLSVRTGEIVAAALEGAGAPHGTLQVISGQAHGVAMLQHSLIRAGSFTGSIRVGTYLAQVAAARSVPIPFFGELGSVNPVFVTAGALAERNDAIADGFVTSVSGSAGQLCTKPGFLFVPASASEALQARIAQATTGLSEHRLLNPGIASGYRERRETILATPGVTTITQGSLRIDENGQGWATPTIARVSVADLLAAKVQLSEEAFGPLAIVVEYENESLPEVAEALFEGNLTGTIHSAAGEDTTALRSLIEWLTENVGRVLFDGWPTGVAVTPAMQHGGPWPATTNDSSTSVGTAAIGRFLRPVAFQNAPQALLPAALTDANPWLVPQRRSPAGESASWGDLNG